jgi:hypothetical protein
MHNKHTEWEEVINTLATSCEHLVFDSASIRIEINGIPFPTKVKQNYLSFLEKIERGVLGITEKECDKWYAEQRQKYGSLRMPWPLSRAKGLCRKVIYYALQDRPKYGHPITDLEFTYAICLEIARNIFSR